MSGRARALDAARTDSSNFAPRKVWIRTLKS